MKGLNVEQFNEHLEMFRREAIYSFSKLQNVFSYWKRSQINCSGLSFSTESIEEMNHFKHLYKHLFLWRMAEKAKEQEYVCIDYSSDQLILWNEEFRFRFVLKADVSQYDFWILFKGVQYFSKTKLSLEFVSPINFLNAFRKKLEKRTRSRN